MTGQERTDDMFEREWRDAFEGVEQAPPRIVWSEIDRTLTHEKAHLYKKKSNYYRWMAAAIFLLATSIGLLQLAGNKGNGTDTIAEVDVDNPQWVSSNYEIGLPERTESTNDNNETIPPVFTGRGGSNDQSGSNQSNFNMPALIAEEDEPKANRYLAILQPESKRIKIEQAKVDVVDEIYRVPSYNYRSKRNSRGSAPEERYWAGLDVASGSFDMNYQSAAGPLNESLGLDESVLYQSFSSNVISAEAPISEESVSTGQMKAFGLNLGMQLSDRWSVQGGLQYMQASATKNTNISIEATQLVDRYVVSNETNKLNPVQDVVQTETVINYYEEEVTQENDFQFATIPVKAGFLVLDNRFSLQINGGVAANLYLGNKLTDQSGVYAPVTIGPGSDSPYRGVSFTGLAGLQLGYQFIENFDLVVEPNYRRALNDLTKGSSDVVSSPSGFGVQTGLRYRFN